MNIQRDAAPETSGPNIAGTVPRPKAMLGLSAAAGILGPIVFTVGFLPQDLLRGRYDPIAQQISELEASPDGWVQQVNFVVFGLLIIAFAVGLHRGVEPTRAGMLGPAIVGWGGVGLDLPDRHCALSRRATLGQGARDHRCPRPGGGRSPSAHPHARHGRALIKMIMTPRLRKLALTTHVTSSVGWLGAVAAFLALAIIGLTSQDAATVRGVYPAMAAIGSVVLVPLSLACLLTGLIQALGTPWGLFRHYWVLFKLLINLVATILLLVHVQVASQVAAVAAQSGLSSGDLIGMRIQLLADTSAALLVLLVAVTLSVYKPKGLTRYGWRTHTSSTRNARPRSQGTSPPTYPPADSVCGRQPLTLTSLTPDTRWGYQGG